MPADQRLHCHAHIGVLLYHVIPRSWSWKATDISWMDSEGRKKSTFPTSPTIPHSHTHTQRERERERERGQKNEDLRGRTR